MTSYSIDGSVYIFPFYEYVENRTKVVKYLSTIKKLKKLLLDDQPKHFRYYVFKDDIKLIKKNGKFDLATIHINKFDENELEIPFDMRDVLNQYKKTLGQLRNRLIPENEDRIQDYIVFEKWFDINDVNFKLVPSLPDNIRMNIQNKVLEKNLRKHITMIAILNKYVYENSDQHGIILGDTIDIKDIRVTANFDIDMATGSYENKEGKVINYVRKIKNLPTKNIQIKDQVVKFHTLGMLVEKGNQYQDWKKVLSDAKTAFTKHVIFGTEVETSIFQYINFVNSQREYFPNQIDRWLKKLPDILHSNLKTLNDFLVAIKVSLIKTENQIPKGYREHFHCNENCEFINFCSSNIRIFGANCVDETQNSKRNLFVKKDRTRKNAENEIAEYNLHLRVNNTDCKHELWFLNMRIYFRWIPPKKIEIGWIGRHLYLPCKPKDYEPGNALCKNCPRKEDPDFTEEDRYNRYIAQWEKPKTDPNSANPEKDEHD